MEEEIYSPAYRGSKQFTQHQVHTANATGFGAATDDYAERGIDLNEQLILNKISTFFFKMGGDAMEGAGIYNGDVLIVDRSIAPASGKIIVCAVDGELLVRRYFNAGYRITLASENRKYNPIQVGECNGYEAWGVVTCVVRLIEPALKGFQHSRA